MNLKAIAKRLGQTTLLVGAASALGLLFNVVRSHPLPLWDYEAHNIYKPCPERSVAATPMAVDQLSSDLSRLVMVDARRPEAFASGHIPGARSIPYDPLLPLPEPVIGELRSIEAGRLLVYGDNEIDSGKLLAGELASAGLLGVRFLIGGFGAWEKAGRSVEPGAER